MPAEFSELHRQTADVDAAELDTTRQAIQPDKKHKVMQQLQDAYGKQFDPKMLMQLRKKEIGPRTIIPITYIMAIVGKAK